jgi:methyl-accepting chemotaxis protein
LGFSVVADEVRKLAEKSAKATHEIEKLIAVTSSRVEEGGRVSSLVEEAFRKIVKSVDATSRSIDEINDATSGQAVATKNVAALLTGLQRSTAQ